MDLIIIRIIEVRFDGTQVCTINQGEDILELLTFDGTEGSYAICCLIQFNLTSSVRV